MKLACLCNGRGWILPPGEEWWVWCPHCKGVGEISTCHAARIFGVTASSIRKVLAGHKVHRGVLGRILTAYAQLLMT